MYRLRSPVAYLCASLLLVVPAPARAVEINGGVSLGGILIGVDPRLAVSPHAGVFWQVGSVTLSVQDHVNILASVSHLGVGGYNQTSASVGYAWKAGNFGIGPSLSIYSMPACNATLCGRVVGVGAGGHAHVDVYFAGALGASVSVNVDWIGGTSPVLPGGVAAIVVAGPVFRWGAL